MRRAVVLVLLVAGACREHAEVPPPPSARVVAGIRTELARTQQVTDAVRAFATVVGDREPAEVRDARAQLADAEVRARLAASQVARLERLVTGGVAPRKELEAAQAELTTANAAVDRARAVLAAFGKATRQPGIAEGETWALAEVQQEDVGQVRPGAAVVFVADAVAGAAFTGRVTDAPTYLSTATRMAPVRLRIDDPGALILPGMTGSASIAVGAPRSAIMVPAAAVLREVAGEVVVVEEAPGQLVPHRVTLGVSREGWAEIRSGVGAGARVVTTGAASALSAARGPADAAD